MFCIFNCFVIFMCNVIVRRFNSLKIFIYLRRNKIIIKMGIKIPRIIGFELIEGIPRMHNIQILFTQFHLEWKNVVDVS